MSYEPRVVVKNAKQTMDALKTFDPEAAKALQKRITKAASTVAKRARETMPRGHAFSNWGRWSQGGRDLGYDGNGRKIRVTRANMRKRGQAVSNYIGVVNPTPAGAIFELAGRQSAADYFLDAFYTSLFGISRKDGTERPGVFRAFEANRSAATKEIEGSLREAESRLQQILDAMGDR